MKMTLTFPDEIGQQIQGLSNPDEFVNQVVKDALKKLTIQQQKASDPHRWAKIAQRIHNDPARRLD